MEEKFQDVNDIAGWKAFSEIHIHNFVTISSVMLVELVSWPRLIFSKF